MRAIGLAGALLAGSTLAACATVQPRYAGPAVSQPSRSAQSGLRGTMRPYRVAGVTYTPREQPRYDEVGVASWYGPQFHSRSTSNGEVFDMDRPSAAHTTLPLPSIVEVTNLDNGRRIRVRVNDRGPFVQGRIIDLSRAAARQLGFYQNGTARVRVRYVGPAGRDDRPARPVLPSPSPPSPPSDPLPELRGPQAPPAWQTVNATRTSDAALRVQIGAYASRGGAERAAERIGNMAVATIEPMRRGGSTLYRVTLGPTSNAGAAAALRDRAADAGFPDAQVIGF